MKRAIIVTTSTVVGVAAVLGYKPNSDTAQALLDITGANNTAATTSTGTTDVAATTTTPTTAAEPTTASTPTATPKATASKKATAKTTTKTTTKSTATPKPTQSSAATTTQKTATPSATPTATATPTPTATKAAGATTTVTGDAARAVSHGKDFGTVTVSVTLVDGKMTKITATHNPEGRNYPYIQAVRQYLIPAVLQAQKANVGYVSGATGTSEAFVQSLQSALAKA